MERMIRATINSWNGMIAATRSEQAFREELALLIVSVPLAFLVGQDGWTRLFLISLVVLVLIVELLNTAIEKLADHVTREDNPEIGRIKDMGSAAVGLALLLTLAGWLWALAERLAAL